MTKAEHRLDEARRLLVDFGLPRTQQNDRTALCLLALADLAPDRAWGNAQSPLIGITPIMTWARKNFGRTYAPNSRETFRRFSMHQLVQGGFCLHNPDKPTRPVNSPNAVYQLTPEALRVVRAYGTSRFKPLLTEYLLERPRLSDQYAKRRKAVLVPIALAAGSEIRLSAGAHSELIRAVIEDFGGRYAPGGELVYVGDTGNKVGYFQEDLLLRLGLSLDRHGKLPDVIIYDGNRNWLLLIECVTSHGPMDAKRQRELADLFGECSAGVVYISTFPTRRLFTRYAEQVAWETEVWVAAEPTHLIHFDGEQLLGPRSES